MRNLQPGGSCKPYDWSRQGRLVGGEAGLAACQQRTGGGPLMACRPRDPWNRPRLSGNVRNFSSLRSRPEALLDKPEKAKTECITSGDSRHHQAQLVSVWVLREVQLGCVSEEHEVQPGRVILQEVQAGGVGVVCEVPQGGGDVLRKVQHRSGCR